MKVNRLSPTVIVICLLILVSLGCSGETNSNAKKVSTQIAMKWRFAATMAPYFAAKQNGIFEDYGLEAELREGGPDRPSISQVLSGQAEFGITGATSLIRGRAQDQPIRSIAVIFKKSPVCLLSLGSSNIDTPQDLVGKTVAMSEGDNIEFEYRAMLEKANIDPSTINHTSFSFQYNRLLTREVDVTVAYANDQPVELRNQYDQSFDCLLPRKHGVKTYADVLFTTEQMIEKNPNRVRRVVFSVLNSWEWAKNHEKKTVEYFLSNSKINSRDMERAVVLTSLDSSLVYVQGGGGGKAGQKGIPNIGIQKNNIWSNTISNTNKFGKTSEKSTPKKYYTNKWAKKYNQK